MKAQAPLCPPTQKHKRELGADVDLGGYVAAGVVAFLLL